MIQHISFAPWVESVQARLPFRIPGRFLRFINAYEFIDFSFPDLRLYNNTGAEDRWSWPVALFCDETIFAVTTRYRFLPIGQPDEANYDRICLDLNRLKNGDCPVVQLDHEEILINERIKIVSDRFATFEALEQKILKKE